MNYFQFLNRIEKFDYTQVLKSNFTIQVPNISEYSKYIFCDCCWKYFYLEFCFRRYNIPCCLFNNTTDHSFQSYNLMEVFYEYKLLQAVRQLEEISYKQNVSPPSFQANSKSIRKQINHSKKTRTYHTVFHQIFID